MSTILTKIGFKEFKNSFDPSVWKNKKIESEEAVGMSVVFDIGGTICSNLPKCEKEIFTFLSSLSGLKVKEIEELPLADFAELVIAVVQSDGFTDFFKVVSRFFN